MRCGAKDRIEGNVKEGNGDNRVKRWEAQLPDENKEAKIEEEEEKETEEEEEESEEEVIMEPCA